MVAKTSVLPIVQAPACIAGWPKISYAYCSAITPLASLSLKAVLTQDDMELVRRISAEKLWISNLYTFASIFLKNLLPKTRRAAKKEG